VGLRTLSVQRQRVRAETEQDTSKRPVYHGHSHFWQRARALSRRRFLQGAGSVALVTLAAPSLFRTTALAAPSPSLPNPIPGGLDLLGNGTIFHVYLPGTAPELATITDFNGFLGAADVLGSWTGPQATDTAQFDADMRFMAGEYIGRDGQHQQGTFAFI
jgi:hypothetical protein